MSLAGLPLLALLGAAFATLLAVVGLYLLRPTPKTHVVSNVQFWVRAAQKARARLLFSRRLPIFAFLVTLLVAMLLVLELGDPRFGAGVRGLTVVVYAADRSMAAEHDGVVRKDAARRLVRDMVQQATARGKVAVVRAGVRPSVVVGLTEHPGDLDRASISLDALDEAAADLDAAVDLANVIVQRSGETEARIVVVGDRAPTARQGLAAPMLFVPVGASGETVAITTLGVRRDATALGEYAVLAQVHAFTTKPARARLEIRDRDVVLSEEELTLQPGQTVTHEAQGFSSARGEITARLENVRIDGTADALALDDHAYGIVDEVARTRVLLISQGDRFLEDALASNPSITLTKWTIAEATRSLATDAQASAAVAPFDVLVLDRYVPPVRLRRTSVLLVAPPDGAFGIRHGASLRSPPITAWLSAHPVLDKVRLEQVGVRQARALVTTAEDAVLVRSDRDAIAIARDQNGQRLVALGFGTADTDFVQRIAFPIFMHDAMVWLSQKDGGYRSYARPGDALRAPSAATTVLLPNGEARPLPGAAFYETGAAGIYHVGTHAFAISGVDSARALTTAPPAPGAPFRGIPLPPLGVLVAALLLVVMSVEWLAYHRGWFT